MNKQYSVRVAGVSHRQASVVLCAPGDPVAFEYDEANRYDARAIAVYARKKQIGFLPKDGWLTDLLLDEGGRVNAKIESISKSPSGDRAVLLSVEIC